MTDLPAHPFRTADLDALGLTQTELRAVLDEGVVRRILQGVYCRVDLPDSVELRAQAAALVLSPHHVVCDRSAAWLWGVDCFDLAERAVPPPLEVVAVEGADRTRRPELLGGKRDLIAAEICEVEGARVTTPVRTACDLACLCGRSAALAALDGFCREHGLTQTDYQRQLDRFRGRRGVRQARELAPYAVPGAESRPESWTRMRIIDDGLPSPQTQVWAMVPGLGWVRLDMAYEHLRIAVEYDGMEFHTSDADRAADEHRRRLLRDAGWVVIVVRRTDLGTVASASWLGELRAVIDQRRSTYRRRYARRESWDPRAR